MKAKPAKAAEFLAAMQQAEEPLPVSPVVVPRDTLREPPARPASRAGLKHFGGYLDDATLEKIALLRHRLKKDNSALIKLAIDDLFQKHQAKRAFGDA
jgi:hypothetical protein